MKLISSSDLLRNGWDLYLTNIKRFSLWGLLFVVVQFIGQYAQGSFMFSLLSQFGIDAGASELSTYVPWMDALQSSLGGVGLLVFGVVTAIIFGVAMVYMVVGSAKNTADMHAGSAVTQTITEYLKTTNNLFWSVVWVGVLSMLVIVLGYMFLIIPGILFSVWFMYASYEVIFKQKRGVEAMKSSKALVSGRFWPVAWRLLAIAAVIIGVSIVITMALAAIDALMISLLGAEIIWVSLLLFSLPNIALVPFSIAVQYVLYDSLHKSVGASEERTVKPEDLAPAA